MAITLQLAREEDLSKIHKMQQEAFAGFTKKYHSDVANLEKEDLAESIKRFHRAGNSYYFIVNNKKPVGVICVVANMRAVMKKLSLLWVMPKYQRHGFGHKAIELVEKMYGNKHWKLNVIKQESDVVRFYEGVGYHKTNDVDDINEHLSIMVMNK